MPELPEVETVRNGLALKLQGRRLVRVDQHRPDLRFPLPADFALVLTGRQVLSLDRRAKYILIRVEGGLVWMIHLGMSGSMVVKPGPAVAPAAHDHLVFHTDDGWIVTYNDVRRFGFMDLFEEAGMETHPMLAGLGPEPLGNEFHADGLSDRLRGRAAPIKSMLLDQKVVAGLGNIYVCEALFRAGIDPKRSGASVAGADAERLVPIIRDVLSEAIAAGGSTLRDFVQSDGELGYFQHSFQVYGREGEGCGRCDCNPAATGGVNRIIQSGRSTFFCPRHQH
ncbi:MAG: bifunctional DNA-formamidopyrimidine glycosylase/DNA-(apurinic or apyrimidinic site) lyase [Niveispirillum sp.]|uniref:bifunctional DNA-formamidopyrimidine glycosylase/DNA-(apurinic or apyrimidinic site) lyase n=1 Tax=Niveispirillum sp. TaxID=1917217 RepID=UPI003BA65502